MRIEAGFPDLPLILFLSLQSMMGRDTDCVRSALFCLQMLCKLMSEPPRRLNSSLVNFLLCSIAVVAGASAFGLLAAMKQPPSKRDVPETQFNVQVYQVESADLREIISGFGTVQAEYDSQYSAEVAGKVIDITDHLKVGRAVEGPEWHEVNETTAQSRHTDGDLLLTIDPARYEERVVKAENGIAEARAELKLLSQEEENTKRLLEQANRDLAVAQDEFDRVAELKKTGTATDSQVSQAQLELQKYQQSQVQLKNQQDLIPSRREQLNTRIDSLETEKRLAELDVRHTRVRPPFKGRISEVHVEKGQYVQPGTPLFRVTSVKRVEIPIPLHPADFGRIASLVLAGEQPRVMLAENENARAQWEVRLSPKADAGTRTISVFVEYENRIDHTPLLPGTFVNARIEGPALRKALAVPREAILGGNALRGRVFVASKGRVSERSIEIDRRLEGMAFLTGGVKSGDQILLTNLDVVKDGSRIDVRAELTLDEELERQQSIQRATIEPQQVAPVLPIGEAGQSSE